jgi:two-component system, chemotaxis family, protein-glutamate methylesterase/glutaminase
MYALPPSVFEGHERHVTGISCPECAGVLEVQREGHGNLRFVCRVGHALSVDELLGAKEDKIENDMWATVRAHEELVVLLEDLEVYARRYGRTQIGGPHGDRISQARELAERIRAILDETRPVDLAGTGDLAAPPASLEL